MSQFNDLFALSEVCLLADVVQLAVARGIAFDASALAEDVAVAWADAIRRTLVLTTLSIAIDFVIIDLK